jgi:CBS domain-containing membrane protein
MKIEIENAISELTVADLMTTDLFTLFEDDNITLAEEMMKWRNIRHIPVINDKNEIVGLITSRDILKISVSTLAGISQKDQRMLHDRIQAKDVMQKKILTIPMKTPLYTAAKLLSSNKVGCLPIIGNGKLVGIITEADFVKFFTKKVDIWN